MARRPGPWARAMTERNFAIIADWFSGCFFIVGSIGITIAGVAAGFGEGVAAGLRIYVLSILFAAASAIFLSTTSFLL